MTTCWQSHCCELVIPENCILLVACRRPFNRPSATSKRVLNTHHTPTLSGVKVKTDFVDIVTLLRALCALKTLSAPSSSQPVRPINAWLVALAAEARNTMPWIVN